MIVPCTVYPELLSGHTCTLGTFLNCGSKVHKFQMFTRSICQ